MDRKTTIYDIARELNITAATVSRALNNNPRISAVTRALVAETAARMNYKQNRLALALKRGKSMNVGVIVPFIDRSFFASVIRAIEDELNPHGYHVIISQTHEKEEKEGQIVSALLNAQVDGIIMSISTRSSKKDRYQNILDKKVPLVFFDRKLDIEGVSSVTLDDFKGGYKATEHLIKQNCKRIAHLAGDQNLEIYKDRFEGCKKALSDYGLKFDKDYLIEVKSSVEEGQKAAEKLLALKNPPDGIFSASDFVALGAIQFLKETGINVPEDMCVIGFANEPFTRFMQPAISSIDQSPLEMGKLAARVFLERVDSESKVKVETKVVLTPEVQIRASSKRQSVKTLVGK